MRPLRGVLLILASALAPAAAMWAILRWIADPWVDNTLSRGIRSITIDQKGTV